MPDKPWKAFERRSAQLILGKRYEANTGGTIDCESATFIAQCKHIRVLPFPELERLAVEAARQGAQKSKLGLVVIKRRSGKGQPTPTLVVMTDWVFREMSGPLPGEPPVAG